MTLQSKGVPISLGDIQGEFGGQNPVRILEYYAGGYVPDPTYPIPKPTLSIPKPTIKFSYFYGTSVFPYQFNLANKFLDVDPIVTGTTSTGLTFGTSGATDDNGFISVAYGDRTTGISSGLSKAYIMRFNNSGSISWKTGFAHTERANIPFDLRITSIAVNELYQVIYYLGVSDTIYLSSTETLNGAFVICLDYNGNLIWSTKINSSLITGLINEPVRDLYTKILYDNFNNRVLISGGNIDTTGSPVDNGRHSILLGLEPNQGLNQGLLLNSNNNGAFTVKKIAASDGSDFGFNGMDISSNFIYITGRTANECVVAQHRNSPSLQNSNVWQRYIKGNGEVIDLNLTFTVGDNVYVGVSTNDSGSTYQLLNKFISNGTRYVAWRLTGELDAFSPVAAAVEPILTNGCSNKTTGDYYIVGAFKVLSNQKFNAFVMKFNSSDVLQWKRSIAITGKDCYARSVWTDPLGNRVYIMLTYGTGSDQLSYKQAIATISADGIGSNSYKPISTPAVGVPNIAYTDSCPLKMSISTALTAYTKNSTYYNGTSDIRSIISANDILTKFTPTTTQISPGTGYIKNSFNIIATKTIGGYGFLFNINTNKTTYYGYTSAATSYISPDNSISSLYGGSTILELHYATASSKSLYYPNYVVFTVSGNQPNSGWNTMVVTDIITQKVTYYRRENVFKYEYVPISDRTSWYWHNMEDADGKSLQDATVQFASD